MQAKQVQTILHTLYKTKMAEITFCPVGGMDGVRVSDEELDSFADAVGSKALDMYIPLPYSNITQKEQIERIKNCTNHKDGLYWERDNGKHGWCCAYCGTVLQWG